MLPSCLCCKILCTDSTFIPYGERSMSSLHLQANNTIGQGNIDERRVREGGRPNARLLHRFYEPMHLLCILNPDRGPREVSLELDAGY